MILYATNAKANFDYEITDKYEAGLKLNGAEVKSVRGKHLQIKDGFVKFNAQNRLILLNCYIAPYEFAIQDGYDPYQPRLLLLHESELLEIKTKTTSSHLTIVPLKVYNSPSGRIKVEIGIGKGKKQFEKRRILREKEIKRTIDRTLKTYK